MDWGALTLSLRLAVLTAVILIPLGIGIAHYLHHQQHWIKGLLESICMLPLVLPPTVLGYYLLVSLGNQTWMGQFLFRLTGQYSVFSFQGILIASIIFNLPFALIPIQRSFEMIPQELKDAAATCGLSRFQTLMKIEIPLAWKGIFSAFVMTIAHTLGEFGVVLMVGGNIPNQTRTLSISIYDKVQSLDMDGAGLMSITLVLISLIALLVTQWFGPNSLSRKAS